MIALLLALPLPALIQAVPRVLQPQDHASPSGRYVLHVDPTNRLGAGPGRYRLSLDGEPVWASEHEVTLWDARVLEDGWTVGYAYDRDQLRVASLSPSGELVRHLAGERSPLRSHGTPVPAVAELAAEADERWFVLSVSTRSGRERWRFDRTGVEAMVVLDPEEPSARQRPPEPLPREPAARVEHPAVALKLLERRELRPDAASELTKAGPIAIAKGRVLIQDRKTAIVHGFDGDGMPLFSTRGEEGDFPSVWRQPIVSRPDESFVVLREIGSPWGVDFERNGTRRGRERLASALCAFTQDGTRSWAVRDTWNEVSLRCLEGDTLLTSISRTPEGLWMHGIADVCVSGSEVLALLKGEERAWDGRLASYPVGPGAKNAVTDTDPFERSGRWLPVHGTHLAATDAWVAVGADNVWSAQRSRVHLIRRDDETVVTFLPPEAHTGDRWIFGFSGDGSELWGVSTNAPTLHRYALPE